MTRYEAKTSSKTPDAEFVVAKICFAPQYSMIHEYEQFNVYVLKTVTNFTKIEIEQYYNCLIKMGFKFSMEETTIKIGMYSEPIGEPTYKFVILIKENSPIANLIIINAIRYLYENPYHNIVSTFLLLVNSNAQESLINKFIISHYGRLYELGHCICRIDYRILKLMSEEKFKKIVLENKNKCINTSALEGTEKTLPFNIFGELQKTYDARDAQEIIDHFKKIYEKYK